MGRRDFLKCSALGSVGAVFSSRNEKIHVEEKGIQDTLKIKEYRTLGRTGFKVSDISAGEHQGDEGMLNTLLDAGVNYIDTGESYGSGRDERVIGRVIKKRDRKSVFITTKLYLREDRKKSSIIERTRKCLERLQTDYIDCLMIHSAPNVATIKEKGFHDAMSQLRAEGRVRYIGLSNHGIYWGNREPEESMEKILLAAAEDGRFDVMLLVYNFLSRKQGEKILRACAEKNIGAALMKTNPVVNYQFFQDEAENLKREGKEISSYLKNLLSSYGQLMEEAQGFIKKHNLKNNGEIRDAAVRFVLGNPHVNTACLTYNTYEDIESFLKLSGSRFSQQDRNILAAYSQDCGILYCRHACGLCESCCPHHVPVNTIMRYNHYFIAQGREKHAMSKYKSLPTPKADKCRDCEGHCEAACPYNVPIHGLLISAHHRLTLA